MIDTTFQNFNDKTNEGKLLLAAIAILTSIDPEHIKNNKWGGSISPQQAMDQLLDLANKTYYKEEWEVEQIKLERDKKINDLLN